MYPYNANSKDFVSFGLVFCYTEKIINLEELTSATISIRSTEQNCGNTVYGCGGPSV